MNELIIAGHSGEIQQAGSIEALLDKFIKYVDVQEVTMKSYAVCLRCFGDWMKENNVRQPKRADIQAYVDYLASPHPRRARYDRHRVPEEP